MKPIPIIHPFNIFLIVGGVTIVTVSIITAVKPDPEVALQRETTKTVQAQVELEKQEETNLRIQNEIQKNKLRTVRVENMTGEQVLQYERQLVIRRVCDGDVRCVLDNI